MTRVPLGEATDDRIAFNTATQMWDRTGGPEGSGSTRRITSVDSPYTLLATDKVLFCDTDGGPITVLLPEGVDGECYRIINTGGVNNDVTLTPFGIDLLVGENSDAVLFDTDVLDIVFETTEGWW
jgi:hypothetical protein